MGFKGGFIYGHVFLILNRFLVFLILPHFHTFRAPGKPLSERLIRRYSSVSEDDTGETRSNIRAFNIFGRRRSSASSDRSERVRKLSRQLSEEEAEINRERLAAIGDFLSMFKDDDEEYSSDQDDLVEDLQNVGYLITPQVVRLEAKNADQAGFKSDCTKVVKCNKNSAYDRFTSHMTRRRKEAKRDIV